MNLRFGPLILPTLCKFSLNRSSWLNPLRMSPRYLIRHEDQSAFRKALLHQNANVLSDSLKPPSYSSCYPSNI